MTGQFFEASGPQGHFFEKTKKKKRFYKGPMGVCVPNFRSVSFFVWPGGVKQINEQIYTHIQVSLGISSTGCSPHGDFDNNMKT